MFLHTSGGGRVANTIEKITRDFLWLGALEMNRDHLVSWEVCCCPKKKGGLDKNDWDANTATQATHSSPWKFISQGYAVLYLEVGNDSRFNFWEDYWVGDSSFSLSFPRLYRLSVLHNAPIQNFYSVQSSIYSWDLHFFQNLNDRESSKLVALLGLFDTVLLSSSLDRRLWSIDPSRLFTCQSYF